VNAIEQHLATRRTAGLFDFSFMSLIEVEGDAAMPFLARLQTRSLASRAIASITYTLLLNEDASVFIDATLWKHAEDKWWLFTGRRSDVPALRAHAAGFDVRMRDRSTEFAVLALQGPASGRMLARLGGESLVRDLRYFQFGEACLGGIRGIVARVGYSGELGYEIVVPKADATAMHSSLLAAGAAACQFDAANSLRIECGYVLFDREITGRENPLQLRLERLVDVNEPHFRGRSAFIASRRSPCAEVLVGLEISDRTASPLLPAARATSECDSPIFRRRIGLGFAPPDQTAGSLVRLADGRLARTARLPFYDPPRRLPRGTPL
jgi:aminomethyltransferase